MVITLNKKILLTLITISLIVIVSGCLGSNTSTNQTQQNNTATTVSQATTPIQATQTTNTTTTEQQKHKILTVNMYSGKNIQIYWRGYDRDKWVLNKIKVKTIYAIEFAPGKLYTVINTNIILDDIKIVPKVNIYKAGKLAHSNIELVIPKNKLSAFNMYLVKGNNKVFLGMFILRPIKPTPKPTPTIIDKNIEVTKTDSNNYSVKILLSIKTTKLPYLDYHLKYAGNYYNNIQYDISTNELSGTTKAVIEFTGTKNDVEKWSPALSFIVLPEDSKLFNEKSPLYSEKISLSSIKNDIMEKIEELNENNQNNTTNSSYNGNQSHNNTTGNIVKVGNFTLYYYKSCSKGGVFAWYKANIAGSGSLDIIISTIKSGGDSQNNFLIDSSKEYLIKLFNGVNVIDQIIPIRTYSGDTGLLLIVKKNGKIIFKKTIKLSDIKTIRVATCSMDVNDNMNTIHYKMVIAKGISREKIKELMSEALIVRGTENNSINDLFELFRNYQLYFKEDNTYYHVNSFDTLLKFLSKYNGLILSTYDGKQRVKIIVKNHEKLDELMRLINSTSIVYFKFSQTYMKPPYYAFVSISIYNPIDDETLYISEDNTKIISGVFEVFDNGNSRSVLGVALTDLNSGKIEFIMTVPRDFAGLYQSILVNTAITSPVAPFINLII